MQFNNIEHIHNVKVSRKYLKKISTEEDLNLFENCWYYSDRIVFVKIRDLRKLESDIDIELKIKKKGKNNKNL